MNISQEKITLVSRENYSNFLLLHLESHSPGVIFKVGQPSDWQLETTTWGWPNLKMEAKTANLRLHSNSPQTNGWPWWLSPLPNYSVWFKSYLIVCWLDWLNVGVAYLDRKKGFIPSVSIHWVNPAAFCRSDHRKEAADFGPACSLVKKLLWWR